MEHSYNYLYVLAAVAVMAIVTYNPLLSVLCALCGAGGDDFARDSLFHGKCGIRRDRYGSSNLFGLQKERAVDCRAGRRICGVCDRTAVGLCAHAVIGCG